MRYIREVVWLIRDYRNKNKIKLYNWWDNNLDVNWFYHFLKHRNMLNDNKYCFFSIFGERLKLMRFYSGKKVFFTGENVCEGTIKSRHLRYSDHCIREVDLSLGFEYFEAKNYLRFPLWIMRLVSPTDSFEDLKNKIKKINNPANRLNPERTGFACQISSHDISGIREEMITCLSSIEEVACAGKFMNNTQELQEKYNNDKQSYLRNFKFNICPENSQRRGYITEKLFDSFVSGCVPVYWGGVKGRIENKILHQDSFLYYDKGNEEELINKVKLLYTNKQAYEDFVNLPPFKESAAEIIWERIEELERRLKY